MEKRFCGIGLGSILEGLRPTGEDVRMVTIYALEETLTGALPYHVLRDDGAPAKRYCLLILGGLTKDFYGTRAKDFHFATLDGYAGRPAAISDMPSALIKDAIAAIPRTRSRGGQLSKVIASDYGTAGLLIVAETAAGKMNCGFARNPAIDHDDAAYLLKTRLTDILRTETGKN